MKHDHGLRSRLTGWMLPPSMAALAMRFSFTPVTGRALRLRQRQS